MTTLSAVDSHKHFQGGLLLALCVAAPALTLYIPILSADFIALDDPQYILDNPRVLHPSWSNAGKFVTEVLDPVTVAGYYQPLTMISLMLDRIIDAHWHGGYAQRPEPFVFHLHNILLHALNAALVAVLTWHLVRHRGITFAAGLIFAFHPLNVEPVAWICQRKTLLATTYVLLCLLCYGRWVACRRSRWYIASLVCFGLSLLAKPTNMFIPFVLLLADMWPFKRLAGSRFDAQYSSEDETAFHRGISQCRREPDRGINLLVEKIPFFVLAFLGAIIAYFSQYHSTGMAEVALVSDTSKTILIVAHNITFYLEKFILPVGLCPQYPLPPMIDISMSNSLFTLPVIGTVLILTFIGFAWRKRWRFVWTLLLGFYFLLAPSLGPVQFMGAIAGDRFAYAPMLLLILLLAELLRRAWLPSRQRNSPQVSEKLTNRTAQGLVRPATAILLFFVVSLLAYCNYRQQSVWKSTRSYYQSVCDRFPDDPSGYGGMATAALFERDQWLERSESTDTALGDKLLEEAQEYYNKAIKRRDNKFDDMCEIAEIKRLQGRPLEALAWLEKAEEFPAVRRNVYIHFYKGLALGALGRYEEAIQAYRTHLSLRPTQREALYNIANALVRTNRAEESIEYYITLIELDPTNRDGLQNYGTAMATLGRYEPSLQLFRRAIELRQEKIKELTGRRRGEELSKLADAEFSLAGALAALGRESEAMAHLQQACTIKPELLKAAGQHPLFESLRKSSIWKEWRNTR